MSRLFIFAAASVLIIILISVYLRYVYFFRDPIRVPPDNEKDLISPCDGLVVYVKKIEGFEVISEKKGEKIQITELTRLKRDELNQLKDGWLMGVYMSPLDVHFNYAPQDSKVKKIFSIKTSLNLPMVDLWEYINMVYLRKAVNNLGKKFHLQNERNIIVLDIDNSTVVLVEIADKFVNKIDCFIKEGDSLKRGQKIAFIRRGSQVDVIVPSGVFKPAVKEGTKVTGAKTVIFKKVSE